LLAVVLPAPTIDPNGAPDTAGYDWQAIGLAADIVQADFGQDPSSYLSDGVAFALLNWAPTQVSRNKFQPILSVSSLDTLNNTVTEISYAEATKPLGQLKSTAPITVTGGASITLALDNPAQVSDYRFDDTTKIYRFKYAGDGATHAVVVNTAASLAQRLNLLLPHHLRGVVISSLPKEGVPADFAGVLTGYRQQSVSANEPTGIEVAWLVTSSDGKQILKTTRPVTDTTITFTAPTDAGSYKVVASIGADNRGSSLINVASSVTTTVATTTTTALGTATALGSTAALTATAGTTTTVASSLPCYNAAFVADVTVPDGTKLKNNENFTKTWRLRNTGTCNWTDDTVLVFNQGTKLGTPDTVKVGAVLTGTEVEVSVQLTAPEQYGKYTGIWQLKNARGNFGTLMSAVIQAGDPPAGAVTAAAATGPVAPIGNIGGFEIGGQVYNFRRPDLMKKAGMAWVKIQSGGGDESGAINIAHSNGFKILLSVKGDSGQVMNSGYQDQYIRDIATMASSGADAIEVWNEPNIDREWPNGQISGANYTALLQKAYGAIKAANPNTLVISAAPAPTGFFAGGCQAGGCNDDVFLAQMAEAGAANYMDCVGAHHNAGTTPPDVSSGRPEGDHYSWYFLPTLNLYYGAFGGARKVCFTELGYLTPEGYPSLQSTAPGFAWAANTTVGQQAQWLAQAASISANSGKVRMMIVFNVDFTYYGSDPQAGYAIIRPGDSCPACDALGAVVGAR
ncbi:MAG TPA: NBR1-Ig-like domain-containing protein, partial [Anaerolineae bacterium]